MESYFENLAILKTNSDYALKVPKRSNRSLSIYLMNHRVQTSILLNMSLTEHLLFNRTYLIL